MTSWMNQISPVAAPAPAPVATFAGPTAQELNAAADAFAKRLAERGYRDEFAGKMVVAAQDLADKLRKYGRFASQKQADFAAKIVVWSGADKPAEQAPVAPAKPEGTPVPQTFAVLQRLSRLTVDGLKLARKNQDSLVWIKHPAHDGVFGKIVDGEAVLFPARIRNAGLNAADLQAKLAEVEADPKAAAAAYGLASGVCSCCGRDLTDPASIAIGIGPICLTKAGW
jgi:hypothetical protein